MTMDDPARRHQQIQAELSQIGLVLPGSLTDRTTRCQRAGCHCHADPPQLHGPYPTWTRKISGRTVTRTLTAEDAERLRPYFDAHRHLRQLITELEAISIQLAGQPGHHTPSREISPLNAGSAHRKPAKTTGQRVLSVAHSGLPTELPVSYRQNCGGDLFLIVPRGLTPALAAVRGLLPGAGRPGCGVLAGLRRGCRPAGWCWSVVAVGAAGCQPSGR